MSQQKLSSEVFSSPDRLTNLTRKKRLFLRAFELSVTNIQRACKKACISRQTFYDWVRSDKAFAKEVSDLRESIIDNTESALFKAIGRGNVAAIIFTLKTRAKDRGYVERQELVGAHGKSLPFRNRYEGWSREQLLAEKDRRLRMKRLS